MKIVGIYSFNRANEIIEARYNSELNEIRAVIATVESSRCRTKTSREKAMSGKLLYSPRALNRAFQKELTSRGWSKYKIRCEYSVRHYVGGYVSPAKQQGAFREIDFVKNRVGLEVQFGKYAHMIYNVCAKMTIFHNLDVIDVGIEIVPVKAFADEMSTGVSFFEQLVWDLEHRGVSNIDIPVLILGVTG